VNCGDRSFSFPVKATEVWPGDKVEVCAAVSYDRRAICVQQSRLRLRDMATALHAFSMVIISDCGRNGDDSAVKHFNAIAMARSHQPGVSLPLQRPPLAVFAAAVTHVR
jgi:hypothetical protein